MQTLNDTLDQVEILTDIRPSLGVVDRGYRGHGVTRTAIGAEIGHMKTDGRLTRCPLKDTAGDAIFAVLCACGHNIRKLLPHLRAGLALFIAAILNAIWQPSDHQITLTPPEMIVQGEPPWHIVMPSGGGTHAINRAISRQSRVVSGFGSV